MQFMSPVVLALAALGAGADGPPAPVPMVATQVRVLEMKDLSWRTAAHAKLTPVARRDGATVWTAPADLLPALVKGSLNIVQAPKVTSVAGQPATVQTKQVRTFVAGMKDGGTALIGGVVRTAYVPEVDQATDGCRFEVTARSIDQGTLAKIEVRSSRVGAIHQVKVADPGCCADSCAKVNAAYQVPEMIEEGIAGEWVIPKDGLLVVGMGPRTTVEKDGKPAVRERVVVVEARPVNAPAGTVSGATVMGREVVYASPAFESPVPRVMVSGPGTIQTTPHPVLPEAFDVAYAEPKHSGHITVHPVYVLAALPWGALPGPMGVAAQAQMLGVGGPVVRVCPPGAGCADAMVTRTAAEVVDESPADRPMPRVPSRHLPGTVTPDGTRAVLPPLPEHKPDPASYDPSGEPRPSPQTTQHLQAQNVKIHGKVVIRGADGVELIADGLTIRTLPKGDAAVKPASATAIKANEPVTPPCCEGSDKGKAAGWAKPKDGTPGPSVAVGAAPLKLKLPNSGGTVELEIHAASAP